VKKKIFVSVISLLCLLGLIFFFYNTYSKNRKPNGTTKRLVYNPEFSSWEEIDSSKDPVSEYDRSDILKKDDNQSGLHNETVLKGYFDHYDENNQELSIKFLVPFTQGIFEIAKLKLLPSQTIHCAPETYIDPNTGKSYSLKKLAIPTKTGNTLWIPTEEPITFENFLAQTNETTYLYTQLIEDYDSQKINYVQKLIVIGLCE